MFTIIRKAFSWHAISRVLGIAAAIWTARLLGPEKYGISGMVLAGVAQIGLLGSFVSDLHLVRDYKACQETAAKQKLIETVFSFRLILSLVAIVALVLAEVAGFVNPVWRLALWSGLIVCFFQINSPFWVMMAEESVNRYYKIYGMASVLAVVLTFTVISRESPAGMDVLISSLFSIIIFLFGWHYVCKGRIMPRLNIDAQLLLKMVKDGRYIAISILLSYVYSGLELPLVGYMLSVHDAGLYQVIMKCVNSLAPSVMVYVSVIYPRLIDWADKDSPQSLIKRQHGISLAALPLMAVATVLLFVVSPYVVPFLFGAQYAGIAYPLAIRVTSLFVIILGVAYGYGIWAQKNDKQMLVLQFWVCLISLVLNVVLIPRYGMWGASSVNLMSEVLITISCFLMCRRAAREKN